MTSFAHAISTTLLLERIVPYSGSETGLDLLLCLVFVLPKLSNLCKLPEMDIKDQERMKET